MPTKAWVAFFSQQLSGWKSQAQKQHEELCLHHAHYVSNGQKTAHSQGQHRYGGWGYILATIRTDMFLYEYLLNKNPNSYTILKSSMWLSWDQKSVFWKLAIYIACYYFLFVLPQYLVKCFLKMSTCLSCAVKNPGKQFCPLWTWVLNGNLCTLGKESQEGVKLKVISYEFLFSTHPLLPKETCSSLLSSLLGGFWGLTSQENNFLAESMIYQLRDHVTRNQVLSSLYQDTSNWLSLGT